MKRMMKDETLDHCQPRLVLLAHTMPRQERKAKLTEQ